jgi:tetratricopeptide (TPR) repeat protein
LFKETGKLHEAREAFEQAIALDPANFGVYVNLAGVRQFATDDPCLVTLESWAEQPTALSVADQIHLHSALAKAYDSLERYEDGFRHLLSANRLKRGQLAYDEAGTLGLMDRIRQLIGREFIQAHEGYGEPSEKPVFIVGMTRSGTTLIEQILASHPQVFGAGELPLLDQVAGSMRPLLPARPAFPEMLLEMMPAHFRTLGALYVRRMTQHVPAALRVTDKMTVNFLFVGLIHLILPHAKIIHAVRDPADTCLSSFATAFTRGHEHTYDLAELGRYYRHYRELMAHWHQVLPAGRIMDVRYEDLVADLEATARRIVSHCGLAWDAQCLDFHRNQRPIRSASAAQVRKPIYGHSVGRWRKYQSFLGPLFAELGRVDQLTDAA